MDTIWPHHVSVTYRDGRTWENDYADRELAEFTAANRSKSDEVDSVTVTTVFREGVAVDAGRPVTAGA